MPESRTQPHKAMGEENMSKRKLNDENSSIDEGLVTAMAAGLASLQEAIEEALGLAMPIPSDAAIGLATEHIETVTDPEGLRRVFVGLTRTGGIEMWSCWRCNQAGEVE